MRVLATKLPLLLAASATIVIGQDVTTTTTGTRSVATGSSNKCAAQSVVDQCVQNEKFELENCAPYDWDCQCISSTNVVGCYNNCPEHPDRFGAQTIRQQNCANAKAFDKTTTAPSHSTSTTNTKASSMPTSSSAGASEATGTPSGLKSNNDENSGSGSVSGEPTKSLSGLEASSSPSQGAAAGAAKVAGGWVAFLGLALGVFV